MIILNLKLDHILGFNQFEVNFSYPRKLGRSIIEGECLKGIPSFRYKKLNVFVGSNASGKTSLIRAIWTILSFLRNKNGEDLKKIVNCNYDSSYIAVDYVLGDANDYRLYRLVFKTKNNGRNDFDCSLTHSMIALKQGDSYEKVKDYLDKPYEIVSSLREVNNNENSFVGWHMVLPCTEENFDEIHFAKCLTKRENDDYMATLNAVMQTLDPAIRGIKKSQDARDAVVIDYGHNERIIAQAGNKLTELRRLSSGTKYGFNITNTLFAIKHHLNGLYLIDEQFSYVNSDIEASLLAKMVELLGDDEQLFFTTHNQRILAMGFPFHSFYFMKKEVFDGESEISVSCASEFENRNNVSPFNMYENDMFGCAPKTWMIDNIN